MLHQLSILDTHPMPAPIGAPIVAAAASWYIWTYEQHACIGYACRSGPRQEAPKLCKTWDLHCVVHTVYRLPQSY